MIACISIHAPREGSDEIQDYLKGLVWISIHAPREGSDQIIHYTCAIIQYFNPRSP